MLPREAGLRLCTSLARFVIMHITYSGMIFIPFKSRIDVGILSQIYQPFQSILLTLKLFLVRRAIVEFAKPLVFYSHLEAYFRFFYNSSSRLTIILANRIRFMLSSCSTNMKSCCAGYFKISRCLLASHAHVSWPPPSRSCLWSWIFDKGIYIPLCIFLPTLFAEVALSFS